MSFDAGTTRVGGFHLHVRVSSREDRGDEKRVRDVRKDTNAEILHGNDIWTGGSGSRC